MPNEQILCLTLSKDLHAVVNIGVFSCQSWSNMEGIRQKQQRPSVLRQVAQTASIRQHGTHFSIFSSTSPYNHFICVYIFSILFFTRSPGFHVSLHWCVAQPLNSGSILQAKPFNIKYATVLWRHSHFRTAA